MKALFGRLKKIFLAGQGRPIAAGILLWMLFASVISEADLPAGWHEPLSGQAMEIASHPFKAGRQFLFDGYQRTFPRQPESQPVTIVAIDEQSLKQLGQWPWPRNRLADLIDAIGKHQPAAVGLDMFMPEPDQTSPARVAANLPPEQARAGATAKPRGKGGAVAACGLTGSGLSYMRLTPLGDLVPGVEIQAQRIKSLFDGRFILWPWWMKWLEMSAMALIGLIMIAFIPRTDGRVAQVLKKSGRAPTWGVMGLNDRFCRRGRSLR